MSDQLDRIISHANEIVNKKNQYLQENYEKTDWTKIEQLDTQPNNNRIIEVSPEAVINNAYMELERGVQLNKLTDPFCVQENQETESNTARSLAQTIKRYASFHSILQAYSC